MTTTTEISAPPSRPWGIYLAATIVFTTTVAYTIYSCRAMAGAMDMPGGWAMSMMWMPMSGQSNLAAAWMFIAMWTAMMIAGVCLIFCGIYRWTPWKSSCLNHCRDPISLMAGHPHWAWTSSLALGLHSGLTCAICCWSLMLIQAVLGMMNLFVMAAIAIIIAVEKMLPGGRMTARIVGTIAAVTGVVFLVRPRGF